MAGVGKSTVGKRLSAVLDYHFTDIDDLMVSRTGKSLPELIGANGESGFIRLEAETIRNLVLPHPTVIATGGSVIYSETGMAWLKKNTIVVCLFDTVEHITERIQDLETRGIIWHGCRTLAELWAQRRPLYEHYADVIISMPPSFDLNEAAKSIKEEIDKFGNL